MGISSRNDLKNYCLKKLGHPVLQINVAPEQIDDRIDEALEKFWEFHGDGSIREYVSYVLEDIDFERGHLVVSDHILSVLRVLPLGGWASSSNLEYTQFVTNLVDSQRVLTNSPLGPAISSYVISQQSFPLFDNFFVKEKIIRFNQHFNRVFIDTDWSEYNVNDILLLECYQLADPEEYRQVYNNLWLKNYATALIKQQWGQNLLKYNNFTIPGNITVDGRSIYADALADIQILEAELISTYTLPTDFFIRMIEIIKCPILFQ